eukprot:jgi/Galph1/5974/GphlegSOOS_G4558.1
MADNRGVEQIFSVCSAFSSETSSPFMVILFPALAVAVGLAAKTLLELTHFPLPYTVVILVAGGILGVAGCYLKLSELSASAASWLSINPPEVLLFVFLPPLIFEGAIRIDWFIFQRQVWDVLLLAFILVILDTILLAVLTVYVLDVNWSIDAGVMFGALLAATDPVACVSLLKESGAAPSIRTLIEGEMQPGASSGIGIIVVDILKESFGGFGVGIAISLGGILIMRYVFKDPEVEISMTIVVSFLSFYVAQGPGGVSGAIAVVTSGLLFAADRLSRFSAQALEGLFYFWEILAFVANTIVFFYSGFLSVVSMITYWNDGLSGRDIAYILVFYILLNILRAVGIVVLSPLLMHTGYKPGWRELTLVSYSGLRGAVALILAQIVAHQSYLLDLDGNIVPRVSVWTSGILGLLKLPDARLALFEQVKHKLEERDWGMFHRLSNSSRFSGADWTFVRAFVDPETASDGKKLKHTLKNLSEFSVKRRQNSSRLTNSSATASEQRTKTNLPGGKNDVSPIHEDSDVFMDHNAAQMSIEEERTSLETYSPWVENGETTFDLTSSRRLSLLEQATTLEKKTPAVNHLVKMHNIRGPKETANDDRVVFIKTEAGMKRFSIVEGEGIEYEIRRRVLRALRSQISQQKLRGFIYPTTYRTLQAAIDKGLDKLLEPLHIFADLERYGWGLTRIEKHIIEFFGRFSTLRFISRRLLYWRYSNGCSIVTALWSALVFVKRNFDINGSVKMEVEHEIRLCISYLRGIEVSSPEILRLIQTRTAVSAILASRRHYIESLFSSGEIDERELSALVRDTDTRHKILIETPLRFEQRKAREVLSDLLFVRNIEDENVRNQICAFGRLRIFNIGVKVLQIGIVSPGMFILLRGLVHLRKVDDNTISYSRASVESFERTETTSPFGHVGSVFGLASCLFSMPMQKSVIVVSPFAHFLYISTAELQRIILLKGSCQVDLYRMAAIEIVNLLCPEAAQLLDEDEENDNTELEFIFELNGRIATESGKLSTKTPVSRLYHGENSAHPDIQAMSVDISQASLQEEHNVHRTQNKKDGDVRDANDSTPTVVSGSVQSQNALFGAFLLRHLPDAQIVRYAWGQLIVRNALVNTSTDHHRKQANNDLVLGVLLTGTLVKVTEEVKSWGTSGDEEEELNAPALVLEKSMTLTVKSDFAILAIVY